MSDKFTIKVSNDLTITGTNALGKAEGPVHFIDLSEVLSEFTQTNVGIDFDEIDDLIIALLQAKKWEEKQE